MAQTPEASGHPLSDRVCREGDRGPEERPHGAGTLDAAREQAEDVVGEREQTRAPQDLVRATHRQVI